MNRPPIWLQIESIYQITMFSLIYLHHAKKKKAKKNVKAVQTTSDKNDHGQKDENVPGSSSVDLWDDEDAVKTKMKFKPSVIPAVEFEPPGCSFNPAHESHQDALAIAVADEMQKIYRDELGPEPVPLTVPGEVIDEEEKYFLDADGEDDDDDQNENLIDDGDADFEKRPHKPKMVTRVELNRRIRRKEQLRAEAEAKKVEELSKEIDSLPDILQEIAREDEEKNKRHLRRIFAKKERLKVFPPRLGKHKFVPASLQVLLSEEKTGSLRQLKGCCTLVKDRFKSLEKRGLVVPSKKSAGK